MSKLRTLLFFALAAPILNGCVVIGATALAADVAIGVTGDVIEGGVNATGAAIDLVTPDGDDEDEDG